MRRRPTKAREERRTFIRLITICVGLSFLSAQASSALHMLPIEHACCAEHGEGGHADGGHVVDHGQASSDGPALAVSNGEGGHRNHCLICSERCSVALLPPRIPELRMPRRDGGAGLSDRETSPPRTRVYAFAPKTSPPV